MTNAQLCLLIAIPTLAVILASLRHDQAIHALRGEFRASRSEFSSLRIALRADIRILTDQTYTHGREIEALRKQRG
jgi:hypothetical protein